MAIEPHAEQENVEPGRQFAFVLARGGVDVAPLTRHAEGLRSRNGHVAKEHGVRHVKVALGMVGRYAAFIAEVGADLAPWDCRRVSRQARVHRTRGVAAGQRDGASLPFAHRRDDLGGNPVRDGARQCRARFDYDTFGTLHRFSPIITGYTTEPVSTTRMAQHACQRAHAPWGRAPRSNRLDLSWQSP